MGRKIRLKLELLADESALKMDHVAHVPQSPASHVGGRLPTEEPSADMLRPDPRDSFFLSECPERPGQARLDQVGPGGAVPCCTTPLW